METVRHNRELPPTPDLTLREAVAYWIRAQYYMLRPWMHPRRTADLSATHLPVTEDLIVSKLALLRAFLKDHKSPNHKVDLKAAQEAGAVMWHDDLVDLGLAKKKDGHPATKPSPIRRRQRRQLSAEPEAPRRRRKLPREEAPPKKRSGGFFGR